MTKQATDWACGIGAVRTRTPLPRVRRSKTLMGRMLATRREAPFEVRLHLGPLVVDDRVVGRVAHVAVLDQHVLAEDPLELRGKSGERRPGALVARVRLELDAHAAEPLEGVPQHQQLCLDVRARTPVGARKPSVADLEAAVLRSQGEVACAADWAAVGSLER